MAKRLFFLEAPWKQQTAAAEAVVALLTAMFASVLAPNSCCVSVYARHNVIVPVAPVATDTVVVNALGSYIRILYNYGLIRLTHKIKSFSCFFFFNLRSCVLVFLRHNKVM